MTSTSYRILIADDHSVIRTGLRYLLERSAKKPSITEADSCQGLLHALGESAFTHLILDLQLGDCNSLELIPGILRSEPGLKILVYTMSSETAFAQRLFQLGVHGFLSKEADEQRASQALDQFLLRGTYWSEDLRQQLQGPESQRARPANPFDELSDREMTVLLYLLQGLRVKEISNRLDLKMSTIATYKVRIFEKLGVNNLADMQRLADLYHVG